MSEDILRVAPPWEERQTETVREGFEKLFGRPIRFKVIEDRTLIGGFLAYVDGRAYDASLLNRLEQVRKGLDGNLKEDGHLLELDIGPVGPYMKEKLKTAKDHNLSVYEYGTVQSINDDIAQIDGLCSSRYGEILEFENEVYGLALELRYDGVGAVLLSGSDRIAAGSIVRRTGRVADIPVGDGMLGRVIDPIGRPLDGLKLNVSEYRPVESPAPGIIQRSAVNKPLKTGILAVDSMIPIGRGQRELIIGDRQTGKTTIALSAMMNQRREDVLCVYCAIGQKASSVAQLVHTLTESGAMEYTVVVASTASDCAALQYLTPYAGCAIAEKFMYDGRDVLIIYDDLTKHAVAYRAMSLLLRRPSGREAYPGDVFYLHSRLLERAAKLSGELGGGSMTALPIVETMAGDISGYIPTNVISITDGQIYLESELFHAGVRPAVNVGLSVSRVGRAAQNEAMRKVSSGLRLQLSQYRDMAVFAQFGADIDAYTAELLRSGERLTELLKQSQNERYTLSEQTALLLAFSEEYFKGAGAGEVRGLKNELLETLKSRCQAALDVIEATGDLKDAEKDELVGVIKALKAAAGREKDV